MKEFQHFLKYVEDRSLTKKAMLEFCELHINEELDKNTSSKDGYKFKRDQYENDLFIIWFYNLAGESQWYVAGRNDKKEYTKKELSKDMMEKIVENDDENMQLRELAKAIGRTLEIKEKQENNMISSETSSDESFEENKAQAPNSLYPTLPRITFYSPQPTEKQPLVINQPESDNNCCIPGCNLF